MKWEKKHVRLVPLALLGAALASAGQAAETPAHKRERQLLERLAKSDAQAAALQQRVEQLEQQVRQLSASITTTGTPPPHAQHAPATAQATPSPAPAPAARPTQEAARSAARSAPGKFEVDEEAAQRALERTLTQTGALLLTQGTVELTPGFTYKRTELTSPLYATAANPVTGAADLVLASQRTRRNEITASLDLRAGLPYNSQLELSLPYNHVRSSQVSDIGTTSSDNGSGIGDITLGIAHAFTHESGWHPDLIGRLAYNFGNGHRQDGSLDLGAGYREVHAEMVALKRQDPLAFVGSVFYDKVFEKDGIRPGDATGVSLSALLAASPSTSLLFGFSQVYRQKQEQNGIKIPGSEQTYGVATLGASSVLSRDTTLITRFGIGLGNDAPRYSFNLSLPILLR